MSGAFDGRYEEAATSAPQPLDIRASLGESVDYPVDALPPVLRDAVYAIVAMAQVPTALAAQSVLAAASLATQGFLNIETITGQGRPCSLFFFTIASSGDRKSTSDEFAIRPVKEREEMLAARYEQAKQSYAIDDAAFKAATQKAKSGTGKNRSDIRDALEACGNPPIPPVQPLLTCDEPTGPGLLRLFADAMPALGLFSDEGATFLGGWAMQDENQAATGGLLSKLWDGSPIKRIRADKDNAVQILHGRRLSVHLMVQVNVAAKLLGNKAVRDQGLLSRILVTAPRSMKGERFFVEPTDQHREHLALYHQRLGRLLAFDFSYRDPTTRQLDCALVKLQPDARARLIQFSDHCERSLGPGGKYEQISDFASKMTENATRLAAVLAYFSSSNMLVNGGLSVNAVNAGIALMEFYASEAARLYGAAAMDDDTANAATLIEWIRKRELGIVGVRYLNRAGPTQTRNASTLKRAIEILVEHKHLVRVANGAHLDLDGKGAKHYVEAYTVIPLDAS